MIREAVVIRHLPGDRWDVATDFREQSGIEDHVAYWMQHAQQGKVWLGGPHPDGSGGMMILRTDLAEAVSLAERDPAVVGGLLFPEVRLWRIVIDSGSGSEAT